MSDINSGLPTKEQLLDHVGSPFSTYLANGSRIGLMLAQLDEHISTGTQENFSLIFRGPTDMPSEQGIFTLENESIGTFDVFLVPISSSPDGLELEAVFNLVMPLSRSDSLSAEV